MPSPDLMPRRSPHVFALLAALALAASLCGPAHAQRLHYSHRPDPAAGAIVYRNGCIACHGETGKGADEHFTLFQRPDSFPDFTACDQTTPEPDSNWKAVIERGGPYRGFSQIMPAFAHSLTERQIDDVIAYLRTFCTNASYPRGELNLPRAIATEKAFPENEVVITNAANASGGPSWVTDVIREYSWAGRNQIEVDVPINYQDPDHQWDVGVGDVTFGYKRELWYSLDKGSILSAQAGFLLPTGDKYRGYGAGTATFEPFLAFDQLFRSNTFVQLQMGGEVPFNTQYTPRSVFGRAALGQSWGQDHLLGRLYSPMIEFLSSRDFTPDAKVDWDILPQMQVTVSQRQHIRADVGYRKPITDTAGRTSQWEFYLLWDVADGHLWSGWR